MEDRGGRVGLCVVNQSVYEHFSSEGGSEDVPGQISI